ncbi:conserved hypothetical protein [Uncinocarpus reesii 1704]|uniref:HECT-type E3 ubiquitin transferase n=1 Tax=Uncinocarpus reesii (strain UAMH 1704) TaxID=336963 RepID=C4JVL2_UNCRE|nr:uncharacterized protein UREG_06604 [Uncinocarpus reesii 1704]EEP81739.1 conserved hypothetical protein [Uncinocarpus reesii 1704]
MPWTSYTGVSTPGSASETASTPSPKSSNRTHGSFLNPNDNIPHAHTHRGSSPSMSRRTHSRSFSNPFPSLFGGKKKLDQHASRNPLLDVIDHEPSLQQGLSRSLSPGRHRGSPAPVPPDHHVIRRCMTCDHSNSFPYGKKGFRCGKCTMMNDLELSGSSQLRVPSCDGMGTPDLLAQGRVSVERTRKIISNCIRSYLTAQLESSEKLTPPPNPGEPLIPGREVSEGGLNCPREPFLAEKTLPKVDEHPAELAEPAVKPDDFIGDGARVDGTSSPGRGHTAPSNKAHDLIDRRSVIMKRTIGLLSNLPGECHRSLVSWFSRLPESQFRRLVDLVGSFVTHRLNRAQKRRPSKSARLEDNLGEFVPTFSGPNTTTPAQLHSALQRDNISKSPNPEYKNLSYSDDWQIKAAARVMALLFRANYASHGRRMEHPMLHGPHDIHDRLHMIPINAFYSTLLDYSDLITDFEAWESRSGKFTFCQYSFFLSIWAKIRILEHDARRQMEAKAREAFFDSILGRRGTSQYLVLKVRRECLVEDSLRGVSEVVGSGQEEIKKGLRIEFVGEEGVDAGGLRKEWFLLLVREVFDPLNGSDMIARIAGLFLYDEDSGYCYFNPYCFESSEQFFLVGLVFGLAIYNSTILDVALPPFAFRKLLASARPNNIPTLSTPCQPFRCTLDDLAEYRPTLARGLRQLLEFDGDVETTFCQDFVINVERYGETMEVALCPGGEKRPVTNSNRREFVDLYVKYMLDGAVSRQFEPFKRGFFTVCGGNALHLFRPEEIELLVRGSDEALDIPSLRAVAVYEHWPAANPEREPVVNWFWDFFARVSPRDQRKILSFITGSDRIPAMGATNLVIRLLCLGQDSERFPIARTCFNMLSLYRYQTREKFESKLWRAVVESEGFGLK